MTYRYSHSPTCATYKTIKPVDTCTSPFVPPPTRVPPNHENKIENN